jgi:hypothetical protein
LISSTPSTASAGGAIDSEPAAKIPPIRLQSFHLSGISASPPHGGFRDRAVDEP